VQARSGSRVRRVIVSLRKLRDSSLGVAGVAIAAKLGKRTRAHWPGRAGRGESARSRASGWRRSWWQIVWPDGALEKGQNSLQRLRGRNFIN